MQHFNDRLIYLSPAAILLVAADGWFWHWTASHAVLRFAGSVLGLGG